MSTRCEAEHPLVSVIIPAYNRLPLLRRTLASVQEQTYPSWEVVVVDDGSTDGTADAVESLRDPRVSVVRLPRTGHLGRVRNAGIRATTGAYVAPLDSDDVWLPGKLRAQVDALRAPGARWAYTSYELVDEDGRRLPFLAGSGDTRGGWIVRDLLTMRIGVANSSLLVERALLREVGAYSEDAALPLRGDLELCLRLAYHARAAAVPRVMVRVLEHRGRTTHRAADPHALTASACERFAAWCPDPELRRLARREQGRHLLKAAAMWMDRGRHADALRLLLRALPRASPRHLAGAALRRLMRGFRSSGVAAPEGGARGASRTPGAEGGAR
ncbi:MAG: glycosyl transferase [Gemmatimonadetes bacterium]|nr:glycosyl transferase [Gemmatimonadota bacterium]